MTTTVCPATPATANGFAAGDRVLGIDPGLSLTGYGCVVLTDGDEPEVVEAGVLRLKTKAPMPHRLMQLHEDLNPLSHVKKYELRAGDATIELPKYLEEAPETVVALAYFDFDLYEPTRQCLEMIRPRLTKGSVVGFDELNDPDSPGETLALMEVFGLENVTLKRYSHASRVSYFVVGE